MDLTRPSDKSGANGGKKSDVGTDVNKGIAFSEKPLHHVNGEGLIGIEIHRFHLRTIIKVKLKPDPMDFLLDGMPGRSTKRRDELGAQDLGKELGIIG
jgi:hypothetical protein